MTRFHVQRIMHCRNNSLHLHSWAPPREGASQPCAGARECSREDPAGKLVHKNHGSHKPLVQSNGPWPGLGGSGLAPCCRQSQVDGARDKLRARLHPPRPARRPRPPQWLRPPAVAPPTHLAPPTHTAPSRSAHFGRPPLLPEGRPSPWPRPHEGHAPLGRPLSPRDRPWPRPHPAAPPLRSAFFSPASSVGWPGP